MANPFQDQFLKAGLTNNKKVKQAQRNQHIVNKKKRKGEIDLIDDSQKRAEQQAKNKAEKDRNLNLQKNQAAKDKAIHAQIVQLINSNKIITENASIDYSFEDNKKIRTITVDATTKKSLVSGMFCIANINKQYSILPAVVAEKIIQRDPSIIVVNNAKTAKSNDTKDEYSDYQIPDDLMW